AIDRGWHDFVHCDEVTLRSSGFVDKDDTVCFRASVYLAGGAMKVNSKNKSRYMSLGKIDPGLYEKVPNYLNSIVQVWYHLGFFRNAIYSASITGQMSGQKKSCVLPALREIFVRLQHRTMPASCSVLCAAFGRKGWSRVCKADPDGFCTEVFHCLESEFIPSEMLKAEEAAVKAAAKAKGKAAKAIPKVVEVPQENRALWETVQEMFEFEVEWIAQAIDGDFSDSSVYQGPCFTLVVRGFKTLEDTLDHYFSPKVIEDGAGLRVRTMRKFRRMPNVLQWYLKRGDYDCCTGLSGVTDTYLSFPRQIDMGKYSEGAGVYHLYAIMVECDDHFLSYIRPEMEGDRGQWYRFDERENASCAVSNATAVDSSFGGEEWLCVNYLYGPSAVLKRPRESRACMLIYLKDDALRTLLREPRLPKLCPELQMPGSREAPTQASVELEAAKAAEAELLEDLDAEQLKEVKKKKAKQKKKQKEKERKNQAKVEEPETAANEAKDDESEEEDEDEEPLKPEPKLEVVPAVQRDSDEEGFEETLRAPRGKRGRAAKAKAGAPDVNSKNKKKEISASQGASAYPAPFAAPLNAAPAPAPFAAPAPFHAAKPKVEKREDREDAAASEGRRSDASSSKAGREPKPASPSPGSPGSPPAVAQAKAREPRDAKPLNGMLNGRSMNGAKPKPEPPDKASAGASAATASRPAANAAASAAANAAANATAGGSASSRSREEVEGEAVTRHPSSSSRSWPTEEGVKVYPEQLITPAHGSLDDCAQFVCALCKLVSRHPVLMRSCLHMFCSGCFNQWVQQTKPQVVCPGCQQPVRQQDVVQLESATGPGLALLHRLYSGMKVRCLYHPELEASRGQSSRGTCSWSGALLDYTAHLGNCQVHAGSGEKAADPAAAEKTARESPHTALAVGMFLATSTWEGLTTGTLPVQRGARVWVSQLDERGEWALGQLYQEWSPVSEAAWVPRCVLTPALFPVHSPFDPALHAHQAQGLALAAGDLVGVQSLHNGWSYGAKMTPLNEAGESGWYPQACISEPLPL
ncbi:unnamed protein product, partial [Effrenium voratum]